MGQRYELMTSNEHGTEVLRAKLDKPSSDCHHCGWAQAEWSFARRTPLDITPEVFGIYCTQLCAMRAMNARVRRERLAGVSA